MLSLLPFVVNGFFRVFHGQMNLVFGGPRFRAAVVNSELLTVLRSPLRQAQGECVSLSVFKRARLDRFRVF